jgi:hypothetical protein
MLLQSFKKGRSSFLKKKKQKTFDFLAPSVGQLGTKVTKVFWFFFSKKNCFLAWALPTPALPTRGREKKGAVEAFSFGR